MLLRAVIEMNYSSGLVLFCGWCLQFLPKTNAKIEMTDVHEGRVHAVIYIPVPVPFPIPCVWMGIYMRSGGAWHAKHHIIMYLLSSG